MIRSLVASAVIAGSFIITAMPAQAQKDSDKCHFAWEDRNAVYKNKNYCFKTSRAKAWFGANSANCRSRVNLSASDWRKIKDAKRRERKYC